VAAVLNHVLFEGVVELLLALYRLVADNLHDIPVVLVARRQRRNNMERKFFEAFLILTGTTYGLYAARILMRFRLAP
jgi:hypothetical protein